MKRAGLYAGASDWVFFSLVHSKLCGTYEYKRDVDKTPWLCFLISQLIFKKLGMKFMPFEAIQLLFYSVSYHQIPTWWF